MGRGPGTQKYHHSTSDRTNNGVIQGQDPDEDTVAPLDIPNSHSNMVSGIGKELDPEKYAKRKDNYPV